MDNNEAMLVGAVRGGLDSFIRQIVPDYADTKEVQGWCTDSANHFLQVAKDFTEEDDDA